MKVAEHKTSVTLIFAKNFGRPKAAFGLYLCLKLLYYMLAFLFRTLLIVAIIVS